MAPLSSAQKPRASGLFFARVGPWFPVGVYFLSSIHGPTPCKILRRRFAYAQMPSSLLPDAKVGGSLKKGKDKMCRFLENQFVM
jgi:hypothetical protein